MRTYELYVEPYIKESPRVNIKEEKINRILDLIDTIVEKKATESHHIIDSGEEFKRFYTGFLGEAAIEDFLGVDLIDWSVGDSNNYNYGDLLKIGLDVGIKTVEYGKFPIIHKSPIRPEIINLKLDSKTVLICGFATIDTLEDYQDENEIISPSLRKKGTKTAFYGFEQLLNLSPEDYLVMGR